MWCSVPQWILQLKQARCRNLYKDSIPWWVSQILNHFAIRYLRQFLVNSIHISKEMCCAWCYNWFFKQHKHNATTCLKIQYHNDCHRYWAFLPPDICIIFCLILFISQKRCFVQCATIVFLNITSTMPQPVHRFNTIMTVTDVEPFCHPIFPSFSA